jgi:hypothetical protein
MPSGPALGALLPPRVRFYKIPRSKLKPDAIATSVTIYFRWGSGYNGHALEGVSPWGPRGHFTEHQIDKRPRTTRGHLSSGCAAGALHQWVR